jgi:hypothetical protein
VLVLNITLFSNIEACRVEAELSDEAGQLIAFVYEDLSGYHVEFLSNDERLVAEITDEVIQKAKIELATYVNRTGLNAPEGLTRVGLAFWLMQKNDGPAMGVPVG